MFVVCDIDPWSREECIYLYEVPMPLSARILPYFARSFFPSFLSLFFSSVFGSTGSFHQSPLSIHTRPGNDND